jgi:DNA (cytosine-5)-methyltransferase 1
MARIEAGRARFGSRFLVGYYGNERGGRSLDAPLGTVTTHDRFALIDGDRMRMLLPAEVRAAMGFPEDYALPPQRKLAVHLLGNAVVPAVAEFVCSRILEAA